MADCMLFAAQANLASPMLDLFRFWPRAGAHQREVTKLKTLPSIWFLVSYQCTQAKAFSRPCGGFFMPG